jgi:hypothetical protein
MRNEDREELITLRFSTGMNTTADERRTENMLY